MENASEKNNIAQFSPVPAARWEKRFAWFPVIMEQEYLGGEFIVMRFLWLRLYEHNLTTGKNRLSLHETAHDAKVIDLGTIRHGKTEMLGAKILTSLRSEDEALSDT
ncbi:MAG: hypothetical protein WBK55_02305 [Alphaproteobacteria bacterium]